MKVLVTGGAGFLGRRVSSLLLKEGYDVLIYDNAKSRKELQELLSSPKASYIEGDVRDERRLEEAAQDCDVTVHLAAIVDVDACTENPAYATQVNFEGTRSALEAARWNYHKKFIFSSSAAVYGEPKSLPVREEHPLLPTNVYGATKASAEMLIHAYSSSFSLNATVLRFFNIYGPGQSSEGYSGVIRRFITDALNSGKISIHGSGKQTRDFIFIDDAASAVLAALHSSISATYNVGTGKGYSILRIAKEVEKISGLSLKKKYTEPRKGDITRSISNIEKIKKELGWVPKTSLRSGLKETFRYYSMLNKEG